MNHHPHDFEKDWQDARKVSQPLDSSVDERIQAGIVAKLNRQRKFRKVYWSAAAVVLLGGFLTFNWVNAPKNEAVQQVQYTAVTFFETHNETKKITLSDGSEVVLEPYSSLELATQFGKINREVKFRGRANFSIAKDKLKPFKIDADNFTVQVLGTKFFLDQTNGKEEVQLFEGKVKINHQGKITYLLPNENWKIDQTQTTSPYLAVSDAKNFSFNDEDFSQIISELESVYNVKISYPQVLASKKIKGKFSGNLDEVLSAVSYPFNLTITKKSDNELLLK